MANETPRALGFSAVPEWEMQECVYLAWPHQADWGENLGPARAELVTLAMAISADGGPPVRMLCATAQLREQAAQALSGATGVEFLDIPHGDIWMRDIGPFFLRGPAGELGATHFRWNGWGGKYLYDHDDTVGPTIANRVSARSFTSNLVTEGGSFEVDGEGTCITTRQCLLNENRNPGRSEAEVVEAIRSALGVDTVLWLDEGLVNDHTDGHVDTLARFTGPGAVLCMEPATGDDPNAEALRAIKAALGAARDARGRRLEVATIPSPGRVEREDGFLLPASYANYLITNHRVLVPTYGVAADDAAVRAIDDLFPGREAIGLDARAIVTGGGAFHCVSREQPAGLAKERRDEP